MTGLLAEFAPIEAQPELARLVLLVAQRSDAVEALEFVLEQPEGGPSCGCGADHWNCDFGVQDADEEPGS